jgi:hypothetical protein
MTTEDKIESCNDESPADKSSISVAPPVEADGKEADDDGLEPWREDTNAAGVIIGDEPLVNDKDVIIYEIKNSANKETIAKVLSSFEKPKLFLDVEDLPETSLHRTTGGIQRLTTPGAVHITPDGHFSNNNNVEDADETEITADDPDVRYNNQRRVSVELMEAELVVPQEESQLKNMVHADQALPYLAQAERIDDDLLNRMMNEATEEKQKRQRSKFKVGLIVIAIISILVLAIVLSVVLTLRSYNDDNRSGDSTNQSDGFLNPTGSEVEGDQGRIPSTYKDIVMKLPQVTQHILLFEARMDCDQILRDSSIFMRIKCGNSNATDGKEAIRLEWSSPGVVCEKGKKPNSLLCNVNISSNVTQFATVFKCGNNYTADDEDQSITYSTSNVETFPITGVFCRSAPNLKIAYSRLCSVPGEGPSSFLKPAMDGPDSCPNNTLREKGTWSICESEGTCSTGQFPCSSNVYVGSTMAFDYIDDDQCEQPSVNGTELGIQNIGKQISSVFEEWEFIAA